MTIKNFEKVLIHITGWALGVYAMVILLFSLPVMQNKLADWTADALSNQINSKVEIGSINVGFLNKVIANDLKIYEPSGKKMATIARMSASLNFLELINGKVEVNTAQLFGVNATLYKATPESDPNFQFIIDAFKSEEKKEETKINFCLNSFIMKHVNVCYDVLSEKITPGVFNVNHLALKDCGLNLSLKCLTNDSINCTIKRLQAFDKNSGIKLKDIGLFLAANKSTALLKEVSATMNQSSIKIDSLDIDYADFAESKKFDLKETNIEGLIALCDLMPFIKIPVDAKDPFLFNLRVKGNDDLFVIDRLNVNTDNDEILLQGNAYINNILKAESRKISANVERLFVSGEEIHRLSYSISENEDIQSKLLALGDVSYSGDLSLQHGDASSKGVLKTALGMLDYDMNLDSEKFLQYSVSTDSINLSPLIDQEKLGAIAFSFDGALNLNDNSTKLPIGKINGVISKLYYDNYCYHNIDIDALSMQSSLSGKINIDDENLALSSDFSYTYGADNDVVLNLGIEKFKPFNLNLTDKFENEMLALSTNVHLRGSDLMNPYGQIKINDLALTTPSQVYSVNELRIDAEQNGGNTIYSVEGDFIHATLKGKVGLADIAASFMNRVSRHLPVAVSHKEEKNTSYDYDITLHDSPILHHFADIDFELNKPVRLHGEVNSGNNVLDLHLDAPLLSYSGNEYNNVKIDCNGDNESIDVYATASTYKEAVYENQVDKSTQFKLNAKAHNNTIACNLDFSASGSEQLNLNLQPIITLKDSLGAMKTLVNLKKSYAVLNDTTWTVSPATVSLYKNSIACQGVKFSNNANSVISIEGKASNNPNDSLIAKLNNIEIQYILDAVNFTAVQFAGKASGAAIAKNIIADKGTPDFKANLKVQGFTLQNGSLGDATIQAAWDKELDAIKIKANFIDLYSTPDAFSGVNKQVMGVTMADGWISPSKNDMRLDLTTNNTNAEFLHGFLGGVFKEVNGTVTGPISIVGPMSSVNLIGDAVTDINLRLRATNVPYHINDTIHLRPFMFEYKDAKMYDKFGNKAIVQALIKHRNFKNFVYSVKADMKELCAYDESRFNSDKFYATVFADGVLTVDGSDGHPLYVNANITPTKGSVFAYDAATPDAIIGNGFIQFQDRDSMDIKNLLSQNVAKDKGKEMNDSLAITLRAKKNYVSDTYLNVNINLTPACEVKLRMDNLDDGYMRTFGYANLTAKWYNKGAFQLFGNYNINSGSYRLYLQDIIFRDLAIQPRSVVEFNGNPFDANIRLLCHHNINSVPLSDLTNTTAFSQNNKVKVVCILDITGKLGNMDFKFDMDLPNVNEEVRQLVRSMINSEEEMNTQMIYLLGLGRFYPNEFARNNGGDNSSQAVNSLLSSTISGQINQMLSNVIGTNSNWNFGSSLVTGEKGWQDLDVEGILSGRLFDERLMVNGSFGYRDNALTNQSNFIGDFEVKWKMNEKGNLFLKGYNQTNDRYFTKATINTQGIGLSWQHDFEYFRKNNSKATLKKKLKKKDEKKR